jgi:hypothetical protein
MQILLIAMAIMSFVLIAAAPAQQPDPAKLLPMVQAQRDYANNQVASCAAQSTEYTERIKALEAELAKLRPAEPPK